VHLSGPESFIRVAIVVLVDTALLVHIRSWFGEYVRQSIGLPQTSFSQEVVSVVLEVHTLVGMAGLLAWVMLVMALGLSAGALPPVAAW